MKMKVFISNFIIFLPVWFFFVTIVSCSAVEKSDSKKQSGGDTQQRIEGSTSPTDSLVKPKSREAPSPPPTQYDSLNNRSPAENKSLVPPRQTKTKSNTPKPDTPILPPEPPEPAISEPAIPIKLKPLVGVDITCGSQAVLNALWNQKELLGSSTDKRVERNRKKPPKIVEPLRLTLRTKLPPLEERFQNSIRSVNPNKKEKIVALTFDLCERLYEVTGYDAEIVNYLRKKNVPATFFAGGKWMATHPEKAMQLMADPLFEIGNHAWTHGNLAVLTGKKMHEQIIWTQIQYEILRDKLVKRASSAGVSESEVKKIPLVPRTFRFPYGTCSRESLEYLAEIGLPAIQWSVVTGDPSPKIKAGHIVDAVSTGTRPGSIIIMHANGRGHNTAEALKTIIPQLKQNNYRCVTIRELLGGGKINAAHSCYELKVGDNERYNHIFMEGTD